MKKIRSDILKSCILLAVAFFVLGGQPIEFGQENTFFQGYLIEKPVIRVGLGVNLSNIHISASSGMKIYEINSRYKKIADDVEEAWIKGRKEKLTEKFLVQVDQFQDREEAELLAQDLRNRVEQRVTVTSDHREGLAGVFQVRIGDFLTRGDALRYIVKLNRMGFKDTWILEEAITEEGSKPLWILVGDEMKSLHDETVLYFIPSNPQSYLSFNGRDYRGIFVLKATSRGIVLVNILNIEDYLRGVVPSELSPYRFPQIEAHKAQAVAARTYAFQNLGANEDMGFDLSDTPQSQFYKGMSAEHPLSDAAVAETRGQVAVYKGRLIDALYTSTCGGMTEDVENVFLGPALPYLRATECVYDQQQEWLLEGGPAPLPVYVGNKNIATQIASLVSLGIIPEERDPVYYRQEALPEEVWSWLQKARTVLGKKPAAGKDPPSRLDYLTLADLLVEGLGWQERVGNLMLESEKEFVLKGLDGGRDAAGKNAAYLIQEGIFPADDQALSSGGPLTRGDVALCLWLALKDYGGLIRSGAFKELREKTLVVKTEAGEEEHLLSPRFYLVRNHDGEREFASRIWLAGGEHLRWVPGGDGLRFLEVVYPPHSNVLDRDSAHHTWQVRKSREELERGINRFYPVGELVDLIARERGESHRVIELLIRGTENDALVKGLRIRRVLGLKETLFVMEKEYDAEGRLAHVLFSGRGWGHGVGLCQVGAFGMARAGADYKQILKKYYQGIKITKIY